MTTKLLFPTVQVAVSIIRAGPLVLTVFNQGWGMFTFPMTKRRQFQDKELPKTTHDEGWNTAAMRATAECLGVTSVYQPQFVTAVDGYHQSDRDGKWKRYDFHLFSWVFEEQPKLSSVLVAEWLTLDDIIDTRRNPISPTARKLASELQLNQF